jgi:hypothetical protein
MATINHHTAIENGRTATAMFQRRKIGRQAVDLFPFTFQMNFTPTLF